MKQTRGTTNFFLALGSIHFEVVGIFKTSFEVTPSVSLLRTVAGRGTFPSVV
jgi:hypothetical protein